MSAPTRGRSWSSATAIGITGLTAAFALVLVEDLRLYGVIPDPSLLPIQGLLLGATALAWARRRWASAFTALVALAVGLGSAIQPITAIRLTQPESTGFLAGTVLMLAFATVTVLAGAAATLRPQLLLRSGHRPGG
jgi:hypothetical protein